MTCPHCQSCQTRKLALATDLGYARFQCRSCRRTFNERTGTPFNFLEMPTDIVFQVVLFRLLFKLSLRDLMQLFLIRGYDLSYETVRDWEARFAPLLADQVRRRRQGRVGRCWYVDETYIKADSAEESPRAVAWPLHCSSETERARAGLCSMTRRCSPSSEAHGLSGPIHSQLLT